MKIYGIIPARYNSTRFPGKPLALICGKPMIQWVYETVKKITKIDDVIVATDDRRIEEAVKLFKGKVIMTSKNHQCGSDRINECAEILKLNDDDIVINIQGDEPLIKEEMILDLLTAFEQSDVYMATLKKEIQNSEEIDNPNVVKVITDLDENAIYFSRYSIPYDRNHMSNIKRYKHIGLYGYKRFFLRKFSEMPKSNLEISESLEQLRVLENGFSIKVIETKWQTIGVDSPEQIQEVEKFLLENSKK